MSQVFVLKYLALDFWRCVDTSADMLRQIVIWLRSQFIPQPAAELRGRVDALRKHPDVRLARNHAKLFAELDMLVGGADSATVRKRLAHFKKQDRIGRNLALIDDIAADPAAPSQSLVASPPNAVMVIAPARQRPQAILAVKVMTVRNHQYI
jgi:hypothetical protein